jgi:hypothetical protein
MRVILIALSLLVWSHSLRSQSLANLDKKFGIKSLRLETDIALYRSKMTLMSKEKDGKAFYQYTSSDITNILDLPVKEVGLIFYKNKLYSISAIFRRATDTDEKQLSEKLADLFGKSHEAHRTENATLDYDWAYQWETAKVFMQYSKYSESSPIDPGQLEIFMYSKKIHQQISNDNF